MPDIDNPFTDKQFDDLEAALESSDKIEAAIKKANRAGIETPGQLEQVREARTKINKILQTYTRQT